MSKKKSSKNKKINIFVHCLMEYARTITLSFLVALFFTLFLSFHAKNEMIKNLYEYKEVQSQMDVQVAKQIVSQADLTKDLKLKKYSICLHVGDIYFTAKDYPHAQIAYELALEKAPDGIYTPYTKLVATLIAQEKFDSASDVINSVKDLKNKNLIKFKARSFINMGDKYYSIGKFLSAAKSYEKAKFYYDKFSKKDKDIDKSIVTRIINSYIETANIMVKSGYNSDAVRFLKKAEKYAPENFEIKYKLAIVYSDLDPVQAVDYFEPLLEKMPQHIDYGVYSKALMKASNIAELEGNPTQAKYYRYKIHSIDLFVNQKVVYKNDIEVGLESFKVKKLWFKYKLKARYIFKNVSNSDIKRLSGDFVLRYNDKVLETVTKNFVKKTNYLYSNGGESEPVEIIFGKQIFTKKELEQYYIDIYLYKDEKYKTPFITMKVPLKSIYSSR